MLLFFTAPGAQASNLPLSELMRPPVASQLRIVYTMNTYTYLTMDKNISIQRKQVGILIKKLIYQKSIDAWMQITGRDAPLHSLYPHKYIYTHQQIYLYYFLYIYLECYI